MEKGTITSVRLASPLRVRLDEMARQLNRRRNWIISEALKEYLVRHGHNILEAQVREESLKIAEQEKNLSVWNQEHWEQNFDVAGWE